MTEIDDRFREYFDALDRAHHSDRCFVCRRAPADVKLFFGFDEDGVPTNAARYGIEDVVLEEMDVMSYRGPRPVCAVCQLNFDAIFALDEHDVLNELLREMEVERDRLWPRQP